MTVDSKSIVSPKPILSCYNSDFTSGHSDHRFTSLPDLDNSKQMLMPLSGYEINAKFIREHAYFKEEDEIILPPGTNLKVIDKMQLAKDLIIIHLREIISPFPLIASPFNNDNSQQESPSSSKDQETSRTKNIINQ